MPLNLNSNKIIAVVKPDYQPYITTGYTPTIIIGSGDTIATYISGNTWIVNTPSGSTTTIIGSGGTTVIETTPDSFVIYSTPPSGMTVHWIDVLNKPQWITGGTSQEFSTGHTHSQYLTGSTTILVGSGVTTVNNISGGTWIVSTPAVAGPVGPSGATGAPGASGLTPTLSFTGSGSTVVTTLKLANDYTITIYAPSGATGAQGPSGATGPAGPSGATGASGATGPQGISGITPTLSFTGSGSTIVTTVKLAEDYTITIYAPSGATGAQGPSGNTGASGATGASGLTVLNYYNFIQSGATVITTGGTNTVTIYTPIVDISGKLDKTVFTGYTASTNQTLTGITADIQYISGVTDSHYQDLTGLTLSFNTFSGNTQTMYNDTYFATGFIDSDNITASYSHANRTVTLSHSSGNVDYYWRGNKHSLTSPWTSTGHTASVSNWYLSNVTGEETDFTWGVAPWIFEDIQVAQVNYQTLSANTFCIREMHSTMDYHSHEDLHEMLGTHRKSGGGVISTSWTANTESDSAVSPSFVLAVIDDEDIATTIPQLLKTEGYTIMRVSGTTSVFTLNATRPFLAAGANQYIYINNPTTGALSNGIASRFYNVYQILVPVTSDAPSQKYRMIFLMPQVAYTSLVLAQGEDSRGLSFGALNSFSAEWIIYSRVTYSTSASYANYGCCVIPTAGISYIIGNKQGQVSIAGVSTSNHAALSNLDWDNTLHTGANDSLAAFNSSGVASTIPKATYSLSGHNHTRYANLSGSTFTGLVDASVGLKISGTTLTVSPTELNYVDGVTSAIQTQLNAKIDNGSGALIGTTTALNINTASGTTGYVGWQSATKQRWYLGRVADTGTANGGGNLLLYAYDDTGAYLSQPFSVIRATGLVNINNGLAISGITLTVSPTRLNYGNTLSANTQTQLNGKAATVHVHSQYLTGGTSMGGKTLIHATPVSGQRLQLKGLSGGTNITITTGATYLTISSSAGATTLDGLTDVTITSATNNDVLRYSSGTTQWINESPSDIFANVTDGYLLARNGVAITGVTQSKFAVANHIHTRYANLSGSTFTGLLDASVGFKISGTTLTVSPTRLNYGNTLSANTQTQLNGKALTNHIHTRYLNLSGGTMTGQLVVSSTSILTAVGTENTRLGINAMTGSTAANYNTAVGSGALQKGTGTLNVAVGRIAGNRTTGSANVFVGEGPFNTAGSGDYNVGIGRYAGAYMTGGTANTIIGNTSANYYNDGSVVTKVQRQIDNSVIIGHNARANVNKSINEIVIGYNALGGGSNTATLGNSGTTATYFKGVLYSGSTSLFNIFSKTGHTHSNYATSASVQTYTGTTAPNTYFPISGYSFIESGGTQISVVGNAVTIYSATGGTSPGGAFLPLSGGTLSGNVNLNAGWQVTGTTITTSAPRLNFGNTLSANTQTQLNGKALTNHIHTRYANLSGSTFTGLLDAGAGLKISGTTITTTPTQINGLATTVDILANVTDRQTLTRSGNTIVGEPMMHMMRTTANQTINAGAGTYVDITNLTFPVVSGQSYAFYFYITFRSAAATTGWKTGVNCPTGDLDFWNDVQTIANSFVAAATHTRRHAADRDDMTLLTSTVTANVNLNTRIEGRYLCTQTGTFAARFANELAADTNIVVQKGSWGWWC